MTLRFEIAGVASEADSIRSVADLLVGVTADLTVSCSCSAVYREPQFPVVELACALKQWASDPWAIRDDFEFDSMSTPEPGWVWLRRSGEGWRVGSIHQDEPCAQVWEEDQVQAAIQSFVSGIVAAVRASASVDPARWLPVLDER